MTDYSEMGHSFLSLFGLFWGKTMFKQKNIVWKPSYSCTWNIILQNILFTILPIRDRQTTKNYLMFTWLSGFAHIGKNIA